MPKQTDLKQKKQTPLMRFRDHLLYAAVTKPLTADDICHCYNEIVITLHTEKILQLDKKLTQDRN